MDGTSMKWIEEHGFSRTPNTTLGSLLFLCEYVEITRENSESRARLAFLPKTVQLHEKIKENSTHLLSIKKIEERVWFEEDDELNTRQLMGRNTTWTERGGKYSIGVKIRKEIWKRTFYSFLFFLCRGLRMVIVSRLLLFILSLIKSEPDKREREWTRRNRHWKVPLNLNVKKKKKTFSQREKKKIEFNFIAKEETTELDFACCKLVTVNSRFAVSFSLQKGLGK